MRTVVKQVKQPTPSQMAALQKAQEQSRVNNYVRGAIEGWDNKRAKMDYEERTAISRANQMAQAATNEDILALEERLGFDTTMPKSQVQPTKQVIGWTGSTVRDAFHPTPSLKPVYK